MSVGSGLLQLASCDAGHRPKFAPLADIPLADIPLTPRPSHANVISAPSLGRVDDPRIHHADRRRGCMAARSAGAAATDAGDPAEADINPKYSH
jgi:hypothetical protein